LYSFFSASYHYLKYLVLGKEPVCSGYGAWTYFNKNRSKINIIASYFADDESKRIYFGLIEARKSMYLNPLLFQKRKEIPVNYGYEDEYFANEFFKYEENEILVDCGAHMGDNIDSFSKTVPNFSKIIALEPDTNNFKRLQEKYSSTDKISLINAGVWEQNDNLIFSISKDGYASHISKGKEIISNSGKQIDSITINVLAIDQIEEVKK
jgi:FkbM family methyltransferase